MKSQLSTAVELASIAHIDQMYGDYQYIHHLRQVDRLVIQAYVYPKRDHSNPYSKEPGDEIDCLRAIAYLHDIIEDTDTTEYDLLEAGICQEVVDAVIKMTKVKGESYSDYIVEVKSNEFARKVKLCDTAANLMNSIKEGNTKRINKYTKQFVLLGGF